MDYRTFYTPDIDGRLYGEPDKYFGRRFLATSEGGGPLFFVRHHGKGPNAMTLRKGEILLVELEAHPEIPWLAQAVLHEGGPTLKLIPLRPLESLDGEAIPEIAPVSDNSNTHPDKVPDDQSHSFADGTIAVDHGE
ncbi:MAG TPA: hypothetical protein VLE72_01660 [Candidatus Saccharimonadales bacterium]|nr:hypothetical protein [Candidatus Saccharimonadales bacterium]